MIGTNPHLLRPERACANWLLRRQAQHRTAYVRSLEEKYGQKGIAVLAAVLMWGYMMSVMAIAALVLGLSVAHPAGARLVALYVLWPAIFVVGAIGLVRARQGAKIGHEHRAEDAKQEAESAMELHAELHTKLERQHFGVTEPEVAPETEAEVAVTAISEVADSEPDPEICPFSF